MSVNPNNTFFNLTQLEIDLAALLESDIGSLSRDLSYSNEVSGFLHHISAFTEFYIYAKQNNLEFGVGAEHKKRNPDFRLGGMAMEFKSIQIGMQIKNAGKPDGPVIAFARFDRRLMRYRDQISDLLDFIQPSYQLV